MTRRRAAAPRRPLDVDDVREVLRARGLRYSTPRRVILGYLSERDRHVSAESLYLALKQRGEDLSLSTVYLNLGVLADAGLVRAFTGANGEALYDSNPTEHYHVICPETGEVRDVELPEIEGQPLARFLRDHVAAQTGWEIDEPRITLRGRAPRGGEGTGASVGEAEATDRP